eukprot:1171317-Rhodomonas_salina.2
MAPLRQTREVVEAYAQARNKPSNTINFGNHAAFLSSGCCTRAETVNRQSAQNMHNELQNCTSYQRQHPHNLQHHRQRNPRRQAHFGQASVRGCNRAGTYNGDNDVNCKIHSPAKEGADMTVSTAEQSNSRAVPSRKSI